MRYLSVCSGIEAASVAWHGLGWSPVAFSEIEKFPAAVLAHHYPGVPNWGDMTKFQEWPDADVDVLVGGTPCQSFSVAGLRKGLADTRGNLMLTYLAIADFYRPLWLVWENVPGVLSSDGGRDFGTFLGALGQLGYGFAYRVLDAQFVRTCGHPWAVPQRRRRVFVVGCLGDWRRSAAVLFDGESLRGNPPPGRKAGQRPAGSLAARTTGGGGLGTDFDLDGGLVANSGKVGYCLTSSGQQSLDAETETETLIAVAHSLRGEGFGASEDGTGRGTPLVPIDMRQASRGATMTNNRAKGSSGGVPGTGIGKVGDPSPTIAGSHVPANKTRASANLPASTLNSLGQMHIALPWAVRRITPTECERLQGFPDGYTDIPWRGKPTAPDGPRYKALGNSMAINVMQWLGERIALVEGME